jgi:hypothetical protein
MRIHADWLLEGVIEPVFVSFPDFRVERSDRLPQPGMIDAQVISKLISADLVIADLSFLNPNAFYEIGIRHVLQNPIIHMQRIEDRIPFDVSLYRAIRFSLLRHSDLVAARAALSQAVSAVLDADYQIDNPVTEVRGRMKLVEHATQEEKVLLNQLSAMERRLASLENDPSFRNPLNKSPRSEIQADKARPTIELNFVHSGHRYEKDKYIEELIGEIESIVPGVVEISRDDKSLVFEIPTGVYNAVNIDDVVSKMLKWRGMLSVTLKHGNSVTIYIAH